MTQLLFQSEKVILIHLVVSVFNLLGKVLIPRKRNQEIHLFLLKYLFGKHFCFPMDVVPLVCITDTGEKMLQVEPRTTFNDRQFSLIYYI